MRGVRACTTASFQLRRSMSQHRIQDIHDKCTDADRMRHLEHVVAAPQTEDRGHALPSKGPSVLAKLAKWADYDSCSSGPVGSSRFLPMKTPLSEVRLRHPGLYTSMISCERCTLTKLTLSQICVRKILLGFVRSLKRPVSMLTIAWWLSLRLI